MDKGQPAAAPLQNEPRAWVAQHGDALFRMARLRVGSDSTAEDLVQETLLAGLTAWPNFDQRSSVRTWLVSILRNKIIDHLRAALRRGAVLDAAAETLEGFAASGKWRVPPRAWRRPDRDAEDREFWDVLARCLAELPTEQRIAFVLRELDGLDTGEICKILEITPTNLWTLLHRARTQLRNRLEARWFGARR